MKRLLTLVFVSATFLAFAQKQALFNYKSISTDCLLKKIKTAYFETEDTTQSPKNTLCEIAFDRDGKILSCYYFFLTARTVFSMASTHSHDATGNIVEISTIRRYPDDEFTAKFGNKPLYLTDLFTYNKANQCIKKVNYSSTNPVLDTALEKPERIYNYRYNEQGLLAMKKEVWVRFGEPEIQTTQYQYNDQGMLKSKHHIAIAPGVKGFKPADTSVIKTTYHYEQKRFFTEKTTSTVKEGGEIKNRVHTEHYDYNYYDKLVYYAQQIMPMEYWEVREYSSQEEKNNTSFDYYKNGLIKAQLWKSDDDEQAYHYFTSYEFY